MTESELRGDLNPRTVSPVSGFLQRVGALPTLGLGISTEYGAADAPHALDLTALRARRPEWSQFLEVGVETAKGLDRHAEAWLAQGLPTTFHFLDVNLDEPEDLDAEWLDAVRTLAARLSPAWLCGDAGLWHVGRRQRGAMMLLPPVLVDDGASRQADGLARLRSETGYEVLPENPPGAVFVGDLHLLDYFARVCERADTGMLLDCAHLAIYQRLVGHDPLDGLDAFPLERVVELHVAGGRELEHEGFRFVEDDHVPNVLPETWKIFEWLVARTPNLKAVVLECERNPLEDCVPAFERLEMHWAARPGFGVPA